MLISMFNKILTGLWNNVEMTPKLLYIQPVWHDGYPDPIIGDPISDGVCVRPDCSYTDPVLCQITYLRTIASHKCSLLNLI